MNTNTNTNTKKTNQNFAGLADDTQALLEATANVTEEAVMMARNRLKRALEAAGDTYWLARDKATQGIKATDKIVKANPYQAVGVAFGVGALLGILLSRRSRD
jgi:ElaB/YqjD/DUF883 family membrane-anchored ribosome-binding protein